MTWLPLACGIHEARRELDPYPACEAAAKATAAEVTAYLDELGAYWKRRRDEATVQRIKRNEEAKMAGKSKYTEEQKADALVRLLAGESAKKIAAEIGCTDSLIYLWRKQAGDKAPAKKPAKAPKKTRAAWDGVARDLAKAAKPRPHTVAEPAAFAHEDVVAFLARLPPIPWALGDAIRLLAFHAIDGDFDDVLQARERIDAHLRAKEAA